MGLSSKDQELLIHMARGALKGFVERGIRVNDGIDVQGLPRTLMEKKGVFVAVYLGSGLKGCVGTVLPVLPVWEACMENARNAAYKDPRFVPLAIDELDHVSLEITIIDTPRPFTQIAQLDAGIHGLILTKGFRREVFLPDSLRDLPQNIEDILIMLRAKADMDDDPGTPEQWELFDAEVVSER